MNKFILALTAAAVILFGFGTPASAGPYGGDEGTAIVIPGTATPGETVTVTFSGCTPGETVNFVLEGQTASAIIGADGTASATLPAPTTPGTYTGTATCAESGVVASFVLVVQEIVAPPGGLPSTGSDGSSSMMGIAAGLFAVGLGLFGVTQLRRRQAAVA